MLKNEKNKKRLQTCNRFNFYITNDQCLAFKKL